MNLTKYKNLEKGQEVVVHGHFTKEEKETKKLSPYFLVKLTNDIGDILYARIWSDHAMYGICSELANEVYVEAEIIVTDKGEYINIDIRNIKQTEKIEEIVVDINGLKEELKNHIRTIRDKRFRSLINALFKRDDVSTNYFSSPCTLVSGYNFTGGLLAHTVRLIQLTDAIANIYGGWMYNVDGIKATISRDLLVTAAMLQDIGKIRYFKKENDKYVKSFEGEMFESTYITLKMILEEMNKLDLTEEEKQLFEHVIGSTNGQLSYGATHSPRSKDAVAFHYIKNLDVHMAQFETLMRNTGKDDLFGILTQKVLYLKEFPMMQIHKEEDTAKENSEHNSEVA